MSGVGGADEQGARDSAHTLLWEDAGSADEEMGEEEGEDEEDDG